MTIDTITYATAASAYRAGHEEAIFVDRSALGMLKITGATRLDLIHRMSTQAVNGLASGQGRATILTTEIGRIIDRLILYVSSEAVYALTGENNQDQIARYLLRFVFFNDDFQLEDASADTAIFGVYGPEAPARLAAAGFPDTDLPLHHWRRTELAGATFYLHAADPVHGSGFLVMSRQADKAALAHLLSEAGITPISDADFDYLRIEAGQPRFGSEISGDYIPLETNLWADISFTKGCYTGQEIIARMESRGRLAKKLYRLTPAAPVSAGTPLTADGKRAGVITSAADGPAGPVALGYVRSGNEDKPILAGAVPITLIAPTAERA